MLVDVHAHLYEEEFSQDLEQVIERAKSKLYCIICNGTNIETNKKVLELSKKYKIIKAALGLYPLDAENLSEKEIKKEFDFIKKHKKEIIGLGEVGLDFKFGKNKDLQIQVFNDFIELGKKLGLPLIIHSRGAESDVIKILEENKFSNVVLHSFNGNLKLVKLAEKNNINFSIPPLIVRSTHFQELVKDLSITKILTETDAPYLGPYKDQRNEPIFVEEVIKKISEIKNISKEETEKNIFMNFQKIFSLN